MELFQTVPGNPWQQLQRADRAWSALKHQQKTGPVPIGGAGRGTWSEAASEELPVLATGDVLGQTDWDVVIAGGTLGILLGWGLRQKGYRVAVLERGELRGRRQEWNISRSELNVLMDLELLTPAELATVIVTEYNPGRVQFYSGQPWWVKDVLNLGVRPDLLLDLLKNKLIQQGGYVGEFQAVKNVKIYADGIAIQAGESNYKSRLLLDMMGHFSPLTKLARQGQMPDGICLVVGGCAQGFPEREYGDLLVTTTPIINHCQYFWEAFPAQDGRTIYLFTYVDTHPDRPSLTELFSAYFAHLPAYQGVDLADLSWQRFVFGFFPSYRRSPLGSHWARILPVGDSSGMQSPLSFGGFGTLLRHLPRFMTGIDAALKADALDRQNLSLLQPYQPNLSLTWLFQQVMRVPLGQDLPPHFVNEVLATAFGVMAQAGDGVLKPFLQDVIQLSGLTQTLVGMMLKNPGLIAQVVGRLGVGSLLDWTGHYGMLILYTLLAQKLPPSSPDYLPMRRFEQYYYGSGQDYHR
jgi:lycopene cyclase CruP